MPTWKRALMCLAVAAMAGLGCGPNVDTGSRGDADKPGAAAVKGGSGAIDPRADAALRKMSATLAKAKTFQVHSTATVDERLDSGQMAQFSRDSVITVGRPDRMQADVRRGAESYRFWYQGKDLTVLDVRRDMYAVIQTPDRIDQMLDLLADEYGIVVPLDDLLYPDPYEGLVERVQSGDYVDQQEIGGRLCDHLLFTQENVDWQIWIDTSEQAVPRKVVITYKDDPEQPQYEAVLDEWKLDLKVDPSQFAAKTPQSARRVEISELTNLEQGEKR